MAERIEFYPTQPDETDKKLDNKFLDMERIKKKDEEIDLSGELDKLSDQEDREIAA